jgi:hypothetical protein
MPTTTLRLYDLRNQALAVHLPNLIDLLAPRSLEARWIVSPVSIEYPTLGRSIDKFMMTGPGRPGEDQLETLADSGASVSGVILSKYAHEAYQVIWGQFVAALPEQTDAWVVIRAIDSTFYEVTTSDEEVLDKIRSAYSDVRVALGPVASVPFPEALRIRMYQIDWFRDGENVRTCALHADDENDAVARAEALYAAHPEMDFRRDGTTVRVLPITFPYNPDDYE